MREIRFSVGPDSGETVTNSYAGWPTAQGLQPCLALQAILEGTPDPVTGYLVNIAVLDELMRERSVALIRNLSASPVAYTAERIALQVAADLGPHAPAGTRWVGWHLKTTPHLLYSIQAGVPDMVSVTQTFEFAAAHRLHCATMSDDDNREYFGKCNNPNGHGHNYVVEVTITGEPDPVTHCVLPLVRFEGIVKQLVIDRLDHKHLNLDCPEFRDVNPSVENITRVIWSLLDEHLPPARLTRVRVWETSKTYAEYGGG